MSAFILIANRNTVLKLGDGIETRQSSELPSEKIQSVEKGEDLGIEEILAEKDGHAFCKLMAGAGQRSLFIPDWMGWPDDRLMVNGKQLIINGEILNRIPTLGASVQTAKQDGLRVSGVSASHQMAKSDWPRLEKYLDRFRSVADDAGVPVAVLLAIASRESRGGNVLRNGWGDRGMAWGWCQVDKRYHEIEGADHPCSVGHLKQAIGIWLDYFNQIKNKFPSWEAEYQVKAAFCAYNAGVPVVNTKSAMNRGTTGNDYGDDCAGRAQYYNKLLSECTPDKREIKLKSSTPVTSAVNLNIPYFSQRDNKYFPSSTCNLTSVAMVMAFYGISDINPNKPWQLEDELFEWFSDEFGASRRFWHDDLAKTLIRFGINDRFSVDAEFSAIAAHLDKGNPCIIAGNFTPSGHIVVARGHGIEDGRNGLFINDPWGEWFASGYRGSGENVHYSYDLLNQVSTAGKDKIWCHFCGK